MMGTNRLLSLRLHKHITVPQIVDLDILNVVTVRNVHLTRGARAARGILATLGRRGRIFGRAISAGAEDGRNVDVLDALASLELRVDLGSGGS